LIRKLAFIAVLIFLLSPGIFAQSTTVSGTIADTPDNQQWYAGTYSFVFRVASSNPIGPYFWNGAPFSTAQTIAGQLDGSGHYSVSIPSNTSITPAGSSWDLTVCPLATAACFTVQSISITGATQTVSPTPPSIRISMFNPPPNTRAYADNELVNATLGQQYFNTGIPATRVCSSLPCGWTSIGGGGSATAPFISLSSPSASTGTLRLANNESGVCWRNAANTGDVCLTLNASNNLTNLAMLPVNSLQKYGTGGSLANTNCTELTVTPTLNCLDDPHFSGPNLGVDITTFGAVPVNVNTVPATTGTISSSTNSLAVASATGFAKGMGIAVAGAGAAQTMTTPSVPTVTPSCGSNLTGLGYTVPAGAGLTPYAYSAAMRDVGEGYTVASANGTTSTGNASLGANNTAITSIASGILNTFTATIGSSANLAPGCLFKTQGTTDDAEFAGWKIVLAVPDGTHVTFNSGVDASRGISTATATGGTLYYWLCNHVVLPTPGANGTQYLMYGRTAGSMAFLGMSLIANLGYTDASYNTFDDYGPTMMAAPVTAWWVPTTPPSSPVNDTLDTTITNISGTTLTLANNATTSVTSSATRFDNVPAILAAQTRANDFGTSGAGGGTIRFPVALETSVATQPYCWVTSTYLNITANTVYQDGTICPADTIQFNGAWYGTDSSSNRELLAQFGFRPHIPIIGQGANPIFFLKQGGSINKVYLNVVNNGGIGIFNALQNGSQIFEDDSFVSGGNGDYMSILFYDYASSVSSSFGGNIRNSTFSTGPAQVVGSTATPAFVSKFGQQWNFDNIYANRRGFAFYLATGADMTFDMKHEIQGNIMPLISLSNVLGGNVAGFITLRNTWIDTGDVTLANLSPNANSIGASIDIDSSNMPSGGLPLITGNAFNGSVNLYNATIVNAGQLQQIGQNINVNIFGTQNNYLPGITVANLGETAIAYSANHTITANEGAVKATASLTFTLQHALRGQTWDIFNVSGGTITLSIDSGTLHGNQATGNIIIANNSGLRAWCDGTDCFAGSSGGGGGGSPGGTTDAIQYNGGGGTFGGVNSPTANGNYLVNYNVTASAIVAPTITLPGVPINPQTGTTYTYLYSDRTSLITATNSAAQTYTLVNPSTTGFGFNMPFILWNRGTSSGALTENASGFTINGGASLLVPINWVAPHFSDGVNDIAYRVPEFGAFPNCTGAGNALQFTTSTGAFGCGASSAGVSSLTGDGVLITNSASTGAVTLTLGTAGAHKFWMNNTGSTATPGYQSAGEADLPATTVFTDKANTYGAFLQDFSAATLKIPTGAGCTASATAMICYDSTNKNWHIYDNNADAIGLAIAATPTNGDLAGYTVGSGNVLANDSGVVAANVVTAASNAAAAKQVCTSGGANKTCVYIDYPETFYVPSANCVNATAASAWSTAATPAALCRAGTNDKDGLLSPWGASDVGYFKVHLPNDWDSAASLDISIDLTSTDTTNAHTIIMQAATSCGKGDGSTTDDVAFNTAQSFGTITLNGNANRTWNATLTGLTKTGCIAGSTLWIKISRTTDTATNVGVYGATVDVARLITVQAN
jgi:hypothetical protein